MDAQLERRGQAVLPDREVYDCQVRLEFLLKLRDVAHVIHPFVEAPREFRGDRLNGDAFVRDSRQNDQQLWWRLRTLGLIHRNLGDELALTLLLRDMAVSFAGFLYRCQIPASDSLDLGLARLKREPWHRNVPDQFRMALDEPFEGFRVGGLPNP